MLSFTARQFHDFWFTRVTAANLIGLCLMCGVSTGQTVGKPSSTQSPSTNTSSSQSNGTTKTRRGEFVIVPIPVSSPALGTGIIPVVGYIFRVDKEDQVSPPSVLGAAGLITDNGSRAFAVVAQVYLKRDTYRVTSAFLQGNLNYNLYGIGVGAGNAGLKLSLKQEGSVFLGEILRKLKWQLFVGPRIITGHSSVVIRSDGDSSVSVPPKLGWIRN